MVKHFPKNIISVLKELYDKKLEKNIPLLTYEVDKLWICRKVVATAGSWNRM